VELGKAFGTVTPNAQSSKTVVCPNAWPTHFFPSGVGFSGKPKIFWRGSSTHDEDLCYHAPSIAKIVEKYPDWDWVFIGDGSWLVYQLIPQNKLHVIPALRVEQYYSLLKHLEASVCVVPLTPHPFNQCKSMIAWQEAAYAGAACIGPDFEEWKRPGVINYNANDKQDLFKVFKENHHKFSWFHKQSVDTISVDLTIDVVNKVRKAVLECF
jgi:hypothetical protein